MILFLLFPLLTSELNYFLQPPFDLLFSFQKKIIHFSSSPFSGFFNVPFFLCFLFLFSSLSQFYALQSIRRLLISIQCWNDKRNLSVLSSRYFRIQKRQCFMYLKYNPFLFFSSLSTSRHRIWIGLRIERYSSIVVLFDLFLTYQILSL